MNSIQQNNLLASNLVTQNQSILDVWGTVPSMDLQSAEEVSLPLLVRQLLEQRAVLTEVLTKTVFQKEARLFDEKTDGNTPQRPKSAISQLLSSLRQETNGQSRTSQNEIRPSLLPLPHKNQEQTPVKERPATPHEMEPAKKVVVSTQAHPPSEEKEVEQKSNLTQLVPKETTLSKQNPPIIQNTLNKQIAQEPTEKTTQKLPGIPTKVEPKINQSSVTTTLKKEILDSNPPTNSLKKNNQELPVKIIYAETHAPPETLREQAEHSNRNTLLKPSSPLLAKNHQDPLRGNLIQKEQQTEKEIDAAEGFPILIPYPGSNHSIESRLTNRKKKNLMEEDPEEFSQEDEFDEK